MKLELKHLAPYLTHKLKAKNCFNEIVEVKGIQFGNGLVIMYYGLLKKMETIYKVICISVNQSSDHFQTYSMVSMKIY